MLACSQEPQATATPSPIPAAIAADQPVGDIVARVGDQAIHFSELNTMLDIPAVGLSLPALGTPERDTVRITLLDKVVSANLIHLDAIRKGVDKDPQYLRAMQRFRHCRCWPMLMSGSYMAREALVTEAEVKGLFRRG